MQEIKEALGSIKAILKAPGKKIGGKWEKLDKKHKMILKCVAAVIILVVGITLFGGYRTSFYTETGHLKKLWALMFFGSFFIYVAAVFFKNPFGEIVNTALSTLMIVTVPLGWFFYMQVCFGNSPSDILNMSFLRIALNMWIMLMIFLLVYAITVNTGAALRIMSFFAMLFTIANIYLLKFRQIPLLYSDLSVMGTAKNVAAGYDYTPNLSIIVSVLLFLDVCAVSVHLKNNRAHFKKKLPYRIGMVLLCILMVTGTVNVLVYSSFLKDKGINVNTFRPIKSYLKNGGPISFARSIQLCMVEVPKGYSLSKVEQLQQEYPSDGVFDEANTPNVIVVMDEAFSDLSYVGDLETNEEVMPFYKSLKENAIKGHAYVSVFGGQTANTEYEFLTGDSKAFLPQGSTPYQLFVKDALFRPRDMSRFWPCIPTRDRDTTG